MSMATANDVERARRDGELFGIPLGRPGLVSVAADGRRDGHGGVLPDDVSWRSWRMLVYMMATGKHPDFALKPIGWRAFRWAWW